jgi:dihydroxyacid dehydratase/phosphogluconate dehydratase
MTAHQLRSRNWFGRSDLDGFVHRSWLKAEGFSDVVFDGRHVVGIANSWSELTNCNRCAHERDVLRNGRPARRARVRGRGPLALVRDGDEIALDVPGRSLTLKVSDDELARRRAAWKPRPPHFDRGYGRLFLEHVLQANEGCDFDYLKGRPPVRLEDTAGPSHS